MVLYCSPLSSVHLGGRRGLKHILLIMRPILVCGSVLGYVQVSFNMAITMALLWLCGNPAQNNLARLSLVGSVSLLLVAHEQSLEPSLGHLNARETLLFVGLANIIVWLLVKTTKNTFSYGEASLLAQGRHHHL